MSELLKHIIVYDVECYPNLFMVGVKNLLSGKIKAFSIFPDSNIDEREKLINVFTSALSKNYYFAGFNNIHYDDPMVAYLIANPKCTTKDLYNFSCQLINNDSDVKPYKYQKIFKSIDMLEILRKGLQTKSLKAIAVNLKHEKIQDLPIDPHENVSVGEFEKLRIYNENDLAITEKIVRNNVDLLEMRKTIEHLYNDQINLISASNSGIAKKILTNFYQEEIEKRGGKRLSYGELRNLKTDRGDVIPVADMIYPRIKFEEPVLQEFLEKVKSSSIIRTDQSEFSDNYQWSDTLEFGGNVYSVGLGGIHTEDSPVIYRSDDEYLILDIDVTSMYPFAFIKNELCPEHLDKEIFLNILNTLLEERVKYKKLLKTTGDKKYDDLQGAMKIALNTFYGLTNSKTFWLFDPKISFTCTINNQLLMLMLAEQFKKYGHKVISANTDGLTLYIPRTELENVRRIYKLWEEMSYFNLEESFYKFYLRRDVNNYLAVYENDKCKYKGIFLPQENKDLLQAFKYPVVTKAINNYILKGIPVRSTIFNHHDIYDFCFSQKCSKQFTNYLQKVHRKAKLRYGRDLVNNYAKPIYEDDILHEEEIQRNLRFFASNPDKIDTDYHTAYQNGYDSQELIGFSVKKKKLRMAKRYEVRTVEKGMYVVFDLAKNQKLNEKYFDYRKRADEVCADLNEVTQLKVEVEQVQDYLAGKFITLFNDYFEVKDFKDYRIDYEFYIEQAEKELQKIKKAIGGKNLEEIQIGYVPDAVE